IYQSGRLQMIPCEDGFQFTKNIKIRFANGHTRAMMMPQINYHGKTLFFVADLLCLTSHLPIGYLPSYDIAPLESMKEKKKYLEEMLENNYTLFFEHDPNVECATLQKTEKGIRIKDTFKLTDWV
ncbi:MAG: MBL fold metallo-hydrolase, partial [Chitinophagaceae bacterium]